MVVALVAGALRWRRFGISARTGADYSQTAQVVKAGKPVVVTSSSIVDGPAERISTGIGIKRPPLGGLFVCGGLSRLAPSH